MDSKPSQQLESIKIDSPEELDRRDLVRKLGRFGAYAAPFTVFAMTASAAGGAGSGKNTSNARRAP
jgi:hypothetical protein